MVGQPRGAPALVSALLALAALSPWPALAADQVCDPDAGYLSGPEYLRAVSLDLRGRPPSLEEYELLGADGEVPDAVLDGWLASPEHAERVVRHHRDLLWNALDDQEYLHPNARLGQTREGVWFRNRGGFTRVLRGAQTGCSDHPAEFDEDGELIVTRVGGVADEGWVWVEPFWDPGSRIKVCALDADDAEIGSDGLSCEGPRRSGSLSCGCGPHLDGCMPPAYHDVLADSFVEDVDRRIRANILEDRPYTDLLEGSRVWVNGPIVHFMRRSAPYAVNGLDRTPYAAELLPDLEWNDRDVWVEVDLGPEQAGFFTSPAFLNRFTTNRGRANQFANNFLCQPYMPPPGGLPPVVEDPPLDLTARDGCKFCHALLEPHAAHWGRWDGAGYLDADLVPAFDAACVACGLNGGRNCPEECAVYKVRTVGDEELPYVGWLPAYTFLEERHHANVEVGPKLLVRQSIASGLLPACVAEKAGSRLLGRELTGGDDVWLDAVTAGLEADWSYRDLVRAVVTSDNYRRVP